MYRESAAAVNRKREMRANPLSKALNHIFICAYFVLLPILTLFLVSWAIYGLTASNFYQDSWMVPSLMLLSTFLAGAFMRQKMEDESGGPVLFVLGILALSLFAWLTKLDIQCLGSVYSHFLPKRLPSHLEDYVLMLPAVGLFGMLFYKYFTLKHYN